MTFIPARASSGGLNHCTGRRCSKPSSDSDAGRGGGVYGIGGDLGQIVDQNGAFGTGAVTYTSHSAPVNRRANRDIAVARSASVPPVDRNVVSWRANIIGLIRRMPAATTVAASFPEPST